MTVQQLITGIESTQLWGDSSAEVAQLAFDSRRVIPASLFIAVRGTQTDGHQYIARAIANGAQVIVAETEPNPSELEQLKCWVKVPNSALALGEMATVFYGNPSENIELVGVTGTNGKTTVATLLYQLFTALGYKVGLLSTVENRIGEAIVEASHTTPDALQLNSLLADMLDAGCAYVFMEVSSHAIDQNRIAGLAFSGGVFTNMSHDHLDYHGSFKAYIEAKKKFFDNLPKGAFAVINVDDKRGPVMVQNSLAKVSTYSLRAMADFKARVLDNSPEGLHLELAGKEMYARLIGRFNAYNLLAVYITANLLGEESDNILSVLSAIPGPAGRATYVRAPKGGITGVVDYAHTPDSVEKICTTLREMLKQKQSLITVVGCGGDRDRSKRPLMAKVACENSHEVILTSDNPRSEDPEAILNEMEIGVPADKKGQVLRISDRRSAITTACRLAKSGDIVLVAGKGHEQYQEIKGVKYPFDDSAILRELLVQNN